MATRTLNLAAFTAKLLAPLPAHAIQANDKTTQRSILNEMADAWDTGMRHVKLALAQREVAWWQYAIAERRGQSEVEYTAYSAQMMRVSAEIERQMLLPAPRKKELKWKLESCHRETLGAEALAVLERDEARLALAPTQKG